MFRSINNFLQEWGGRTTLKTRIKFNKLKKTGIVPVFFICSMQIGGIVEEAKVTVEKQPKTKKVSKVKKWGEKGFVGKMQFGCYEYKVKFLPEEDVVKYIDSQIVSPRTYGAICCDDQIILVSSDLTTQTQKLSLMHELVHMIFLNNNVGVSENTLNIQQEELVDNVAARFLELMKRNPDLMRWLLR